MLQFAGRPGKRSGRHFTFRRRRQPSRSGFERIANSDPAKVAQLVLTEASLDEPPLPRQRRLRVWARSLARTKGDRRSLGKNSPGRPTTMTPEAPGSSEAAACPTCRRNRSDLSSPRCAHEPAPAKARDLEFCGGRTFGSRVDRLAEAGCRAPGGVLLGACRSRRWRRLRRARLPAAALERDKGRRVCPVCEAVWVAGVDHRRSAVLAAMPSQGLGGAEGTVRPGGRPPDARRHWSQPLVEGCDQWRALLQLA
jgi:hypothetical protein